MTDEEWMAAAPPRIREIVRNSENRDNQEKMGLQRQIQLVANNQPPQKKQLILNKLQGIRSKQGLQELLALILPTQGPTENVSEEDEQIFAGAGAPMVGNTSNQANDDLLIPPTLNYDEEYEDSRNGKARSVRHSSTGR